MTVAYAPRFFSEEHAAAYLDRCNNYVDYWRSLYPSGVAVGTTSFCPSGGCLALFLNRYDVFNVFKPDLGGSWVEYNGGSLQPTYSPAPTWKGGCDEPHNFHLDKCFRKRAKPPASKVVWDSLGSVGQFSVFLLGFMAMTLSVSIFLARARKRRRKGESYVGYLFRDAKKGKKRKKRRVKNEDLEETMLDDNKSSRSRRSSKSCSRSKSRSRSKSAARSRSDKSVSGKSHRSSKSRSKSRSRRSSSRRDRENYDESEETRQQLV